MSLISDAIKRSQRERDARKGSGAAGQPSLDGFFPYVSPAPDRKKSKLVPIASVSVIGAALLAFIAWSLFARPEPQPTSQQPSILPPPPNPVATRPVLSDTATKARADSQVVTVAADSDAPDARRGPSGSPAPVNSRVTANSSTPQRVGGASGAGVATETRSIETSPGESRTLDAPAAPASRASSAAAPTDYEAQATIAFNAGDLVVARDKFQLATRYAPTARAWTNYGVTLQRLGDLAGASRAYQSAIGVDANYLEAWLFQGRVSVLMGQSARAIPLFMRAREIDPRNSEVNVDLAALEARSEETRVGKE
jgi:hypothetical protein